MPIMACQVRKWSKLKILDIHAEKTKEASELLIRAVGRKQAGTAAAKLEGLRHPGHGCRDLCVFQDAQVFNDPVSMVFLFKHPRILFLLHR